MKPAEPADSWRRFELFLLGDNSDGSSIDIEHDIGRIWNDLQEEVVEYYNDRHNRFMPGFDSAHVVELVFEEFFATAQPQWEANGGIRAYLVSMARKKTP